MLTKQQEVELRAANEQLAFQNKEKERRAAELIIANKELAFQNSEKEKRAAELLIANQELAFQNEEKEKRAAELIIANQELAFQNNEKEKRAAELIKAIKQLRNAEDHLKDYVKGIREILFVTSHKVRGPVANILGVSDLFIDFLDQPDRLVELIGYLKESALSLDAFTRELTNVITELEQKGNIDL